MFGESESTIKRALDKLEKLNIIKRKTWFASGNGRANKKRILSTQSRNQWKIQTEPTNDTMESSKDAMEGSNTDDGRFNDQACQVHGEPTKENSKQNSKENLSRDGAGAETADAKKDSSSAKPRELEDLSIEELTELDKLFKLNDRENYSYMKLKKMFNLKCSLDRDLSKRIKAIITKKEKELQNEKSKAQFSIITDEKVNTLANFLRCDKSEVLNTLCSLGVSANYMLRWISECGDAANTVTDSDEYRDYRKDMGFDTHLDVVKMMLRMNNIYANEEW